MRLQFRFSNPGGFRLGGRAGRPVPATPLGGCVTMGKLDPIQREESEMSAKAMETIKSEVEGNPIVLFMKGTPDFPQCGFSARSAEAMRLCGVPFKSINVFDDQEVYREGVKEYSNWPTIPQLFVNGELIGGSDIIVDLFQSGELKSMLENAAGPAPAAQ
jgi:monothiol glutaredoxin